MVEAEQALTTESDAPTPEETQSRQPRKLVEIIPSQLEALRVYHRAVLETDEVEAVHKMRVTTRRLQAALDLLEREMKVRKLKKRLRDWRRALSRVRNYDVFLELIEKEATSRRRAHREQFEFVKAILQERRVKRAANVRRFIERISLEEIAASLGLKLASITGTPEPDRSDGDSAQLSPDSPETEPASQAVDEGSVAGYAAERLEQRLAEFQALVAQSHPTTDPAELHQLRIAAKRVRYLMEIVSQMGFGDASRALSWLRTLQDRIGDWHDLEALEEEIIAIVSKTDFMKQHLAESSRMLQAATHLQKKKNALVARLFPVRVPRSLTLTSQRITKAMRRASVEAQRTTPHETAAAR